MKYKILTLCNDPKVDPMNWEAVRLVFEWANREGLSGHKVTNLQVQDRSDNPLCVTVDWSCDIEVVENENHLWHNPEVLRPQIGQDVITWCEDTCGQTYGIGTRYMAVDVFGMHRVEEVKGFRTERLGYGKVLAWRFLPQPPTYLEKKFYRQCSHCERMISSDEWVDLPRCDECLKVKGL